MEQSYINKSDRAASYALRLLRVRPQTISEIKRRLSRKGFDSEVIDQVINQLKNLGYLNDLIFTQSFIEFCSEHRPVGRRLLVVQLLKHGVSREIIDQALITLLSEDELACRAVKSKFQKIKLVEREQIINFLLRRGFSYSVANQTVKEFISQ